MTVYHSNSFENVIETSDMQKQTLHLFLNGIMFPL